MAPLGPLTTNRLTVRLDPERAARIEYWASENPLRIKSYNQLVQEALDEYTVTLLLRMKRFLMLRFPKILVLDYKHYKTMGLVQQITLLPKQFPAMQLLN